jgi:hypothetical protein
MRKGGKVARNALVEDWEHSERLLKPLIFEARYSARIQNGD